MQILGLHLMQFPVISGDFWLHGYMEIVFSYIKMSFDAGNYIEYKTLSSITLLLNFSHK